VDHHSSMAGLSGLTSVVSQQHVVDLQSSTSMPTIDDKLTAGSGTVKCHMMMPVARSAADLTTLQTLHPLDAMSMVTVNSIMVDISPLPIETTAVSFANFQSFDVSNRLVKLECGMLPCSHT